MKSLNYDNADDATFDSVTSENYAFYAKSLGVAGVLVVLLAYFCSQVFEVASKLWLAAWTRYIIANGFVISCYTQFDQRRASKASESSVWRGSGGGTNQMTVSIFQLLPAGLTNQAQTFRVLSGHMAECIFIKQARNKVCNF